MIIPLIKTFLVLIIGTFAGYIFQKLSDKYHWIQPELKKGISVFLQKLVMYWMVSITYIGSLWIYDIENIRKIISMTFVGAFSTITGGLFAVMVAKYYRYNRIDTGSMFSCGYFANNVTLGGMICFFYFGEEGYALVPIFTFFSRLLYYGLGYPIARMYSDDTNVSRRFLAKIIEVIKDPFFYIGVSAVFIGIILSLSPYKRPDFYAFLNEILIPLSTFILLFSIGFNLKFRHFFKYIKESLWISIIKFIAVPLATLVIVLLLGYQTIRGGLPLKVSIILSAMPVAFNSVITANVYNLNVDMVNICWIFTNFATIMVLPVILAILEKF